MTKKKSEDIPRFVLSITDTKTTMTGPKGKQYMSINIGADTLAAFVTPIPEKKRKNAGTTEMEAMLLFFADQVAISDANRVGSRGVKLTQDEEEAA